ncbi:MFS transporter [Stakelama tenebrarum]|uniref:MFS transporter n=1 Tax=Stakelama tenebrarum TaxID=2711215 RepID=A0A6G6Y1Q1_9SPHN|nr:MFS transporter [Sphingosinithalassobacter tenebrarum]QIG78852.1 MFS transporter [Sphingosinithalassobacter tenebrarum]
MPEPLRIPRFRAMWAATIVSQFGTFIQVVATSWAMVQLEGSATMVSLVQTAANLPTMLFAVSAGALADIFSRRSVMLGAQFAMLLLSALLAALAALGALTPMLLLALTFLIGCGTAVHWPAWQASVGELVPRAQISSAVAANIVGNNVARSLGPAIGGAIVLVAGATLAFLANALSYLAIITVLWRWRPEKSERRHSGYWAVLAEGFRYGVTHRHTRALLIRAAMFSLSAAAIWGLMPVVAVRLDGGPDLLGILFGCFGVGAMGGAVAAVTLRDRFGAEAVLRGGIAIFLLAIAALGLTKSIPVAVIAHLAAGAGWVSTLSTFNVTLQLGTPRELVGRTIALYQTTTFGGLAIGSLIWGMAADRVGVGPALTISAICLALGLIAGTRLPLPRQQPL